MAGAFAVPADLDAGDVGRIVTQLPFAQWLASYGQGVINGSVPSQNVCSPLPDAGWYAYNPDWIYGNSSITAKAT